MEITGVVVSTTVISRFQEHQIHIIHTVVTLVQAEVCAAGKGSINGLLDFIAWEKHMLILKGPCHQLTKLQVKDYLECFYKYFFIQLHYACKLARNSD